MEGKTYRKAAVAVVLSLAAAACFAEAPGQAIYTAKCQMCHGATGMADSPAGKAMKVKPVTDPDVKKFTEEQMITATKDGSGKMKPFKDSLTDAQIKDAVSYFRTFLK
jgi:cytochrome c6